MIRRFLTLVAIWAVVLAGLALGGPATGVVVAHSQLVTSVPAAGEVVATSPSEIRLVFSEPIDAGYTKLDLIGPDGAVIESATGSPDPGDPYTLVASVPALADGIQTVNWRALSATDGHTTSGFFTFGVGDVSPPSQAGSTTAGGSIHAGHDEAIALLETESRIVGDLGLLLAFGLPLIAWLVLREPRSAGVSKVVAAGLVLAALGAGGLLALGAIDLGSGILTYASATRTGNLLVARFLLSIVAAVLVGVLAAARPRLALGAGGLAGLVGLVLLTLGSHAAGYASPAPAIAIVLHLIAVATWLSGLIVIAWVALNEDFVEHSISTIVSRFSALALVSVGLIGLTGVYSDWVNTRTLVSLETPYSVTLLVKSGLALAAFAIGGRNYFSGGRLHDGGFGPRVVLEAGVALSVLIATGVLASGSPPAGELPVVIAPATSSAAAAGPPPTLALAPGRPGPTRFLVTVEGGSAHEGVELQLQRLDQPGETRLELAPLEDQPGVFAAAGGLLPAGSRWDASVVLRDHSGAELGRSRYAFALDEDGISEGRAAPAIDPAVVIALVLLVAGALGIAFSLGGGALPRVDPAVSRVSVVAGSVLGAILAVVILIGGNRL